MTHEINTLTRRQQEVFIAISSLTEALARAPSLEEICTHLGLRSRGSLHKHVQALTACGLLETTDGLRRGVRLRARGVIRDAAGALRPSARTRGGQPGKSRPEPADADPFDTGSPGEYPLVEDPSGTDPTAIRCAVASEVVANAESADPRNAASSHTDVIALPYLGRIAAGRPIESVDHGDPVEVPRHLLGTAGATRAAGTHYVLKVQGDSMCDDGILDEDWIVVEYREHARNGEVVVALIDECEATLKRLEQRPARCVLHPCNARYAPIEVATERLRIQGVVVAQMRKYS